MLGALIMMMEGRITPEWKNQKAPQAAEATPSIKNLTCKGCGLFTAMGKSGQGYCRKLASKKSTSSKACNLFRK
ncbi:MAG: hypothetical protein FJZ49_01605 [Candidatus Verstraetearchaeota archaeon]|nr:hypothetical protein [Candidatus Verstraetearchaeota archaeon]